MTRQSNQILKAALISALIAIGGMTSAASAGGHRNHRHSATCGCQSPEYAGKISIDGCSTSIRSDRPMNRQIVNAFRKAGYIATICGGRVVVEYVYDQPYVRWSTDRYRARFSWDHSYGELTVSLNRYFRQNKRQRNRRRPIRVARRSIWGFCD